MSGTMRESIGRGEAAELPSGLVTFLFTDIEGSTRLIEEHGDAAKEALARHHDALRNAVEQRDGRVFNIVGDAFCCAFDQPANAVAAALDAQRALHHEQWGSVGAVRVRMGVHTGAAEAREGAYVSSLTLVRAQRVMAAGHGGQTLLSSATADRIRPRLPNGTTLRDLGVQKLRGLTDAEPIFQLVAADLPSEFPPLRVDDGGAPSGTLLQGLIRGRLIGRTGEANQLKAHWAEAQQARGHLVLLSGEPGIGKTRLAQELIANVRSTGAVLLRGGCYEFEATTPYLPFVEAFREWAHWASDDQLRTALGATAPEIAKFAPEIETRLGALAANASLSPTEERLRLFDNIARFLQRLAADRGLLLFVDDLHWADQGTLSLLHYLLRHLRNHRVLVLAAYRELELDRAHPLARALVEWNRERLATRLSLGRLSHGDTGALLATLFGQDVSDEFVSALYRETEGNPFFIEEVVKSLIEQGEIFRENGEWSRKETHELTIPQSVKEAIGRRLDRLSVTAADTLRTAAALGKVFLFHELAAVCDTSEDALLDALDEGNSAQLIRDAGVESAGSRRGDGFAFTHDKIREVLYEEMNPIRRRRLHQRIGLALETLHAREAGANPKHTADHAQDLAHHFINAGDLERSLVYSRQAAESAERVFALDEAIKFLEQARESAEALSRALDVAALDERIGDCHVARGSIRPAIDHYERALSAATSTTARAALKVKVGNACVPVGDPHGLERLQEALVELDPLSQTAALAFATALVGRYHHYRTEHRKAIEYLERARQLAEPLGDPIVLGNVYVFLAGAHQHLLLYDKSDEWARTSIALGEARNYPEAIASGYEFLSENAAGRGHWDAAIAYSTLDEQHGRKTGSLARIAWSGFAASQARYGKGELVQARDGILDALALCEQIGEERLATWLEAMLATVVADLGDAPAAQAHAERGWERARRLDQLVLSTWALSGVGWAALARSDIAAALAAYEQCVQLLRDTENNVARNFTLARAADAFLRAGRIGDAEAIAAQALAVAERGATPHYRALARQMQGRVLAGHERYDEAARAFDDAMAAFTALGSRLDLARSVLDRASVARALDQMDDARRGAERAQGEFASMHAAGDRHAAERLLTTL